MLSRSSCRVSQNACLGDLRYWGRSPLDSTHCPRGRNRLLGPQHLDPCAACPRMPIQPPAEVQSTLHWYRDETLAGIATRTRVTPRAHHLETAELQRASLQLGHKHPHNITTRSGCWPNLGSAECRKPFDDRWVRVTRRAPWQSKHGSCIL